MAKADTGKLVEQLGSMSVLELVDLKNKLEDKDLPEDISIAQPHPRSVIISLNLGTVRDYRLLSLTRPNRLVLDIYGRAADAEPVKTADSAITSESTPPVKPATTRTSVWGRRSR